MQMFIKWQHLTVISYLKNQLISGNGAKAGWNTSIKVKYSEKWMELLLLSVLVPWGTFSSENQNV